MENMTVQEFSELEFRLYENNPVIKRPDWSPMVADPSIITKEDSPDGRMHLFAHTTMGIYQYCSDDGISFINMGQVVPDAMRADARKINGEYYIFYEHLQGLIGRCTGTLGGKWTSSIYCVKSKDLIHFGKPFEVIGYTEKTERVRKKGYSISNPFLIKVNDKYRMYYSCGLTYIPQCKFTEPTYICAAESMYPDFGYEKMKEPILKPDKNSKFFNLSCGCIKVYKLKDGYIGMQNGLYNENGRDKSAIQLLGSEDGINFRFIKTLLEPAGDGWMKQFVYASHMIREGNKLRLYFNARDTAFILTGREHIGLAEAELKGDK